MPTSQFHDRVRYAAAAVLPLVATLLLPATSAHALPGPCQLDNGVETCTFLFTGDEQSFVVPTGVTQLHVDAVGGNGGPASSPAAGADVIADLPVTPGATLYVEVGGNGSMPGGSSGGPATFGGGAAGGAAGLGEGGGSGGGASD